MVDTLQKIGNRIPINGLRRPNGYRYYINQSD